MSSSSSWSTYVCPFHIGNYNSLCKVVHEHATSDILICHTFTVIQIWIMQVQTRNVSNICLIQLSSQLPSLVISSSGVYSHLLYNAQCQCSPMTLVNYASIKWKNISIAGKSCTIPHLPFMYILKSMPSVIYLLLLLLLLFLELYSFCGNNFNCC